MNQHLLPSREEPPQIATSGARPRGKKLLTWAIWLLILIAVGILISPVFTTRLTSWLHPNSTAPLSRREQAAEAKSLGIPVLVVPAHSTDVPVYIDGVGAGKAWNSVLIR